MGSNASTTANGARTTNANVQRESHQERRKTAGECEVVTFRLYGGGSGGGVPVNGLNVIWLNRINNRYHTYSRVVVTS